MQKIFAGMLLVCSGLVGACGGSSNSKSEDLSYQFVQNGCDTGKHSFKSKEELCNGLKDDALNKGCALGLRMESYQQQCDSKAAAAPVANAANGRTVTPSGESPRQSTINMPEMPTMPSMPAMPAAPETPKASGKGGNNLSYRFNVNNCDTGWHTFDSAAALCEGLLDDSLNNGCASDAREREFQEKCKS